MSSYVKIPLVSTKSLKSTDFYELVKTVPDVKRVSVQVWWEGFNAFDGSITCYVKKHENSPYVKVPILSFSIDDEDGLGGGSCIFIHNDYSAASFAIRIDKGTSTTGSINTITETNERNVGSSYSYAYGDRILIYPSVLSNVTIYQNSSLTKSINTGALVADVIKEVNTLSLTNGIVYSKALLSLSDGNNTVFAGILRLKTVGDTSIVEVLVGSDVPEGYELIINFFN